MPEPEVLSRELLDDALNRLPGWTTDGSQLERVVELSDEQHEQVAAHVEQVQTAMNHHADVARDGQRTSFLLSTHSAGGVTVLDLTLASEIDNGVRAATGEEPPRPPEETMAAHTLNDQPTDEADQPGAESKARTAEVVAEVQDTHGATGEDNTLPSDGAEAGSGGAHRADGTGDTAAHRAEPTGRREVWAEQPDDETTTARAAGSDRPDLPSEGEQDRQRDWELEQEGGARPHDPDDPGQRDNL